MEKKEKYVDKIVIQKCLCHLQWHCWRIFFLFLHSLILSSAIPYWIWFIIWLSLALNTKNILFFFHYTIRFYSRRQHSFKLFHFLCLVYCRNIFWYWSGVLFILKIFKSSYLKITLYFFMSTWFQNLTIIGEKHNYEVANIFFSLESLDLSIGFEFLLSISYISFFHIILFNKYGFYWKWFEKN